MFHQEKHLGWAVVVLIVLIVGFSWIPRPHQDVHSKSKSTPTSIPVTSTPDPRYERDMQRIASNLVGHMESMLTLLDALDSDYVSAEDISWQFEYQTEKAGYEMDYLDLIGMDVPPEQEDRHQHLVDTFGACGQMFDVGYDVVTGEFSTQDELDDLVEQAEDLANRCDQGAAYLLP